MKTKILCILLLVIGQKTFAQNNINWTKDQLLEPSELSATLKSGKNVPVILSVGPGATILHSVEIGMIKDSANMAHFKKELESLSKDAAVVVYCGCCPFEHCPNVRPAIQLLNDMHFTNYKLLNLPHNIKADWIDKGFPTK